MYSMVMRGIVLVPQKVLLFPPFVKINMTVGGLCKIVSLGVNLGVSLGVSG